MNYLDKYNSISQAHKLAVDAWALSQCYKMYVDTCDREGTIPVTEKVYSNMKVNLDIQMMKDWDNQQGESDD